MDQTAPAGQVSFRRLKELVTIEQVAAQMCGVSLKRQGKELRGPCPICHADSKRCFAINPVKQTAYCHSCSAGGDLLKLVSLVKSCTLREAGVAIAESFGVLVEAVENTGAIVTKVNNRVAAVEQGKGAPNGAQQTTILLLTIDGSIAARECAQQLLRDHPWIVGVSVVNPITADA